MKVQSRSIIAVMIMVLLMGCMKADPVAELQKKAGSAPSVGEAARVLVVMNETDPDSVRIAGYYLQKRKISRDQLVAIKTTSAENISPDKYKSEIEGPIKAAVSKNKDIDYIVLTKGIPLRLIDEGGYSVDAMLAAMNMKFEPIGQTPGVFGITEKDVDGAYQRCHNPYFNAHESFSSKKYNMYLVTRLIGYTVADCLKLVDNSLNAAESKSPILLDSQPKFQPGTPYWEMEESLSNARDKLSAAGVNVYYERTESFSNGREPLAGYASWGSNDSSYDPQAYHELKFVPGAIAETFVSTSARTFTPTDKGQSLIADLIKQGVTGVKGYVSEPFTFALCRCEVLFDRYTNGYNLAESFYAATPVLKWKDMVVGDPLCRPYKSKLKNKL